MPISASDIKFVRSLQQKKFRQEHGLFVVEGVKPVQELIASELEIETVYGTSDAEFTESVADFVTVSKKELERISGLKTPNKVLATARIPMKADIHWQAPLILALDGISDPGNLGTIIRTAKWFGLDQIICSKDCVDAYDRKVVQSTMGALFHTDIIYTDLTELLSSAATHGFRSVGAAMSGSSIYTINADQKTILVIGSESHGISPAVLNACAETFTIPNREGDRSVESLNAGIATAIFLSEMTRNR